MPGKQSPDNCGCPVLAFQKLISGKYKVRILWDLQGGPLRYSEIRRGLLRGAVGLSRGSAQGRVSLDARGSKLRADRCGHS
jgi:hypothetical protein